MSYEIPFLLLVGVCVNIFQNGNGILVIFFSLSLPISLPALAELNNNHIIIGSSRLVLSVRNDMLTSLEMVCLRQASTDLPWCRGLIQVTSEEEADLREENGLFYGRGDGLNYGRWKGQQLQPPALLS